MKEQFATRAAAGAERDRLRHTFSDGKNLVVYRCDYCGCFHLKNRKSRARRKATTRR